MKTPIRILFILLPTFLAYSQDYENCEETYEEVLHGEVYDYLLPDCVSDVNITTENNNTRIHGITLVGAISSINIKATGNNKVNIKPDGALDFINLIVTEMPSSFLGYFGDYMAIENRSGGGNDLVENKSTEVTLYPNPVEKILTIGSTNPVTYYKIVNEYNITVLEGQGPFENKIDVQNLSPNLYYILVKIEGVILVGKFIKN